MTRYALLIESSQLTDLANLPGARADVRLLRRWLMSPKGGAWRDDEIVTLSHPTIAQVKGHLALAKEHDYTFTAFSGHGHHVVGNGFNQTRVCLNDDEEMAARSLSPGNPRSMVLIDCCRGLTVLLPQQLMESRLAKSFELSLNRELIDARATFDRLVRGCDPGAVYLYSCDIKQSAAEDENGQGGLFTLGLVRSAEKWEASRPGYYYSVGNAFRAAAAFTTEENPQQTPRLIPGTLKRYFPFALSL